MKFTQIKPFVIEMFTFVFSITLIFACLLSGHMLEIRIHLHLLIVVSLIIVFVSLLSLFSRIVTTGIKALVDYAFQSTRTVQCEFVNALPYKASIFAGEYANNEKTFGMYYLIHFNSSGKILTFISPSYIDLKKGTKYTVTSGKSSNVYIGSLECRNSMVL